MTSFITEPDIWGIWYEVQALWVLAHPAFLSQQSARTALGYVVPVDLLFARFYNQVVPEAWRETKATVDRHSQEIIKLARDYDFDVLWYRQNGQYSAAVINRGLLDRIKEGSVELPTYLEIEHEKMRWQSHPDYIKERGYSQPIEEEVVQLRIHK